LIAFEELLIAALQSSATVDGHDFWLRPDERLRVHE
jgi:hypothetical protein